MDKTESDKLIAVFDGWEFFKHKRLDRSSWGKPGIRWKGVNPPDFRHWETLMPVIEKITQYKFDDSIYQEPDPSEIIETCYPRTFGMISNEGLFMFRFNRFPLFQAKELIDAAYDAVVDFIGWYNTENK